MVVCKFFQQGHCRFGDNCKFEHPKARDTGFASQNRFSAFQNPTSSSMNNSRKERWTINPTTVKEDLTEGKNRPKWILSTYGPTSNLPASLFDGNELSFEELRLRHYELKAAGNEQQAINEANGLWAKAEQQMADVARNVDKITAFMEQAEKRKVNRFYLEKMDGKITREQYIKESESASGFGSAQKPASTAFGAANAPAGGAFGAPSQPAFGQSAFGQPAGGSAFGKPGASSFGQSSGLGQSSQSAAFGQPAFGKPAGQGAFGTTGGSTFGQPSQSAPAFGQTGFGQAARPAFGQPAQPSGAFGQPSQAQTPFGQSSSASPFGAAANKPSPLMQSQPSAPFGQSAPQQPAFGQSSQPAPGFGQPSPPAAAFGQAAPTASPFGQPAKDSPFGQPSQATSAFGQGSQGGGANQPVPAFGQATLAQPPAQPPAQPQTGPFGSTSSKPNPFEQPSQPFTAPAPITQSTPAPTSFQSTTTTATSTGPHPLTAKARVSSHYTETIPSGQTQKDPTSKRLTKYKGRPVKYDNGNPSYERPDGRGWERIWFPDGATNEKLVDIEVKADLYTDEVKEKWKYFAETGGFEAGKVPTVAPMRNWLTFDF